MTISQTIRLQDMVSPALGDIHNHSMKVISAFEELERRQRKLAQQGEKLIDAGYEDSKVVEQITDEMLDLAKATQNLIETGDLSEVNKVLGHQEKQVNLLGDAYRKLGNIIKSVIGIYSVNQLMGMSDQLVQSNARLGLIAREGESVEELGDKIFIAAQKARTGYFDFMNTVNKIGMQAKDAFSSNDEIIRFSESLSKIFAVSGLDSSGISSVMYNLTQSLSTGRLLGNDYRILKMNAPEFVKMLKDTYANGSQEVLDQMVTKGQVTAEMLKNAVLSNVDEIEGKFEKMPVTWNQAFTMMKNDVLRLLRPVLNIVSNLAQKFHQLITFIEENWENVVAPILKKVLIGIGAYILGQTISTIATVANTIANYGLAGSLLKVAAAQGLANLSMLKYILIGGLIIGLFYAFIKIGEKVTGKSIDFIGAIMSALYAFVAFVYNIVVVPIANIFIGLFNFLANGVTGTRNTIEIVITDMVLTVAKILQGLAGTIDAIFGSNIANSLNSFIDDVERKNNELKKISNREDAIAYLDNWNVADAAKQGYEFGTKLSNGITNAFDNSSLTKLLDDATTFDSNGNLALNTTSSDDLLKEEDIQLLLDVATRDFKLDYQNITPEITLTFTGDVNSPMDMDGVVESVINQVAEAYDSDPEVVSTI